MVMKFLLEINRLINANIEGNVIYLAKNNNLLGYVILADELKPESIKIYFRVK